MLVISPIVEVTIKHFTPQARHVRGVHLKVRAIGRLSPAGMQAITVIMLIIVLGTIVGACLLAYKKIFRPNVTVTRGSVTVVPINVFPTSVAPAPLNPPSASLPETTRESRVEFVRTREPGDPVREEVDPREPIQLEPITPSVLEALQRARRRD